MGRYGYPKRYPPVRCPGAGQFADPEFRRLSNIRAAPVRNPSSGQFADPDSRRLKFADPDSAMNRINNLSTPLLEGIGNLKGI